MTTIACNRQVMAADTQGTDVVKFAYRKIVRIKGSLFGFCGDIDSIEQAITWLKGRRLPASRPVIGGDDDFGALELARDGIYTWGKALARIRIEEQFFAIGSGAQAAVAAMILGLSPREAVGIAARVDPNTGGDITETRLYGKPKAGNP